MEKQSTIYWFERLDPIPRMFLGRYFCVNAEKLPKYLDSIRSGAKLFKAFNVN